MPLTITTNKFTTISTTRQHRSYNEVPAVTVRNPNVPDQKGFAVYKYNNVPCFSSRRRMVSNTGGTTTSTQLTGGWRRDAVARSSSRNVTLRTSQTQGRLLLWGRFESKCEVVTTDSTSVKCESDQAFYYGYIFCFKINGSK